MPDLPASGVFHVSDYGGMGGTHWRPPIASIEFAANKSCTLKSATASCSCTLTSIGAGKFSGNYDLDGKRRASISNSARRPTMCSKGRPTAMSSVSAITSRRAPNNDATLGYFGRGTGTDFDSYKIGTGNPAGLAEASGGLYTPAILNYKVSADSHGSNQWFYWGLAPLKAETPDEAGLKGQLAGYVVGAGRGTKEPAGLIIGLFYHGGGGDKVQHLADVGVRDVVKLDGSDSVLLGHGSTVLWGNAMSHHKRVWMRWGIAFYPY
jgi:hypothetical protein